MTKKLVLHLLKDKLTVYEVGLGKNPEKLTYAEAKWNPKTLTEKLELIKNKFKLDSLLILLGDDISSLLVYDDPDILKLEQEKLETKAKKDNPDIFNNLWSFNASDSGKSKKATFFSIDETAYTSIMQSAQESKMKIEAIIPIAYEESLSNDPVLSIATRKLAPEDPNALSISPPTTKDENPPIEEEPAPQKIPREETGSLEDNTVGGNMKKNANKLWIVLLIIGIALLGSGIYFFNQRNKSPVNEADTEPTQEVIVNTTPSPTPTPTPEAQPEEYSVSILNGSGIAGEAGEVEDLLTDAGFTDTDTGNADNYDYTDTIIEYKESVPASVIDLAEDSLSSDFTISRSDEMLDEDADFDIVVTVGQRVEEE